MVAPIPLKVELGGRARDRTVTIRRPDATIADLAAALGLDPDAGLAIDGRWVNPPTRLCDAGLVAGSRLASAPPPATPPARPAALLACTGGLAAGQLHHLTPGLHVVGRDPSCDVVIDHDTVSGRHCELTITPDGR
ncbi:MAG: FHA domain-containing protein, partial [Actinobacteria bacterium]|nr:FHA domain-containing protein [Actinomycetota bacterium]